MKVLVVHNQYQSTNASGEDTVFENEVSMLRRRGIDVITYTRCNDEINERGIITNTFGGLWSWRTYYELDRIITVNKPILAHFHNIWYVVSPSAYFACKKNRIPIIQTLHNYRLLCVNALLFRNGSICEDCLGNGMWKGVIRGCFRDSVMFSAYVASIYHAHALLGTWKKIIDGYIVLSEFCRKKMIKAGFPEAKIYVKPNFLGGSPEVGSDEDNEYAVFIGRLSPEKGLQTLIKAWKRVNGIRLKVVGNGPLLPELKRVVEDQKIKGVEILGRKDRTECMEILKGAAFLIFPSECYETFGMTILEAYAVGRPVVCSRLGGLVDLVEEGKTGILFEPKNVTDLMEKINWMVKNRDERIRMGRNARKVFEERYSEQVNFSILTGIYEKVLGEKIKMDNG